MNSRTLPATLTALIAAACSGSSPSEEPAGTQTPAQPAQPAQSAQSSGAQDAGTDAGVEDGVVPAPRGDAADGQDAGAVPPFDESEIQSLFNQRCVQCHSARSDGINLTQPFSARTVGVPAPSDSRRPCQDSGLLLIERGDRHRSLLFQKISGTQTCGRSMPTGGNRPFDGLEQERLGLWIDGLVRR